MGDQTSLGPFVAEDSFLRHIDRKRYIADDDTLSREIFKPRAHEPSLSFTYQDAGLKTSGGLDEYQRRKALPSKDLPGICRLTFYDLTVALEPPLPPRGERNPDDTEYGHLHCSTDPPRGDVHMEKMAKLATRNGVARRFVRAPKKRGLARGED